MQPLRAGGHAPALRSLSIGSGREVELRERDGVPLVLVFHLQGTASAAERVNRAVRARYTVVEVTVASVMDLSGPHAVLGNYLDSAAPGLRQHRLGTARRSRP